MTLIPDLERQLTDAAGSRVRAPRRLARLAAVTGIAAALLAGLLTLLLDRPDEPGRAPAGLLGLDIPRDRPPELRDLFAVFRREATPRDDSGWTKEELDDIPDRQPREDPTRSRRVGPPDDPAYLWPMRDGVCSSFGNCLKTDVLVDLGGVSLGTSFSSFPGGRQDKAGVHGIAVDGIEEIRLTRPGEDDIVVPVERNTFRLDVSEIRPLPKGARWTDAGGEEHAFSGTDLFPRLPDPPG
jgi:hypothetical protein